MPGTDWEILEIARRVARMEVAPDHLPDLIWADATRMSEDENRHICALAIYEMRCMERRKGTPAQRKARRLLRSLLTAEQLRQLRDCKNFDVVGTLGGRYRLYPGMGSVRRLERHGQHYYEVQRFCIHARESVPPADTSIAHMLLLITDEAEFLETANASRYRLPDCWNGEYLRRMRRTSHVSFADILGGNVPEGAIIHIDRDPEAEYILGINR